MTETTNVLAFRQPSAVDDPLTDIVRAGARDLLARAIEIEVGAFLASTANLTLPDGRARLVRAGPGCLDSAPLDLSGFLPGYAERGA
ncbi:hypothetical protein JQ637_44255, partial [Bradyrhizobium diazoefficiens]|nr:hypothetical protein [Bradyrhizobium diazoefficiens]MBR0892940.1 hypothetical protein [Bradyrhizobium diazoefficiens]